MTRFLIALVLCLTLFQTNAALAQNRQISSQPNLSKDAIRQRVNAGTVTVITGGVDGVSNTYQQLAGDMAAVLDVRTRLRVLPVVGYGSLQNIEDLLYLRGIDIGMVHSDVMRHMEQRGILPSAKRRLRYITKLYDEPLHLLVNSSITDIRQLDGRTVIVGRPGSGNEMSALTLISDLGIKPNLVHVPFEEGVEQVRSGRSAAMFVVTRRPASKLQDITADGNLRFLPIPVTDRLADTYESVNLTADDYPNLIAPGESVETPQMAAVLAVYNWQPGSPRYENVTAFISNFADKVSELTRASRKDVWEKLDPAAPVKGWQRYGPASGLAVAVRQKPVELADRTLSEDEVFRQFVKFVQNSDNTRQLRDDEVRDLYARFQQWRQTRR